MEIKEWNGSQNDLMRIIQESVPGKQITMAHIISSPDRLQKGSDRCSDPDTQRDSHYHRRSGP